MYFTADDGLRGTELWVSDGTPAGTLPLINIHPTSSSFPANLTVVNNIFYFVADNGVNGRELWISDGSSSGTFMLKDINPNGSGNIGSMSSCLGKLFFRADNGVNGAEPWISDGTVNGTRMLKDMHQTGGSGPLQFFEYQNKVFFTADNGVIGSELYTTDGTDTGTRLFRDINPLAGSYSRNFIKFGGKMIFTCDTAGIGSVVYISDGTPAGTYCLTTSTFSSDYLVFKDRFYFSGFETTYNREPWYTDGTPENTGILKDLFINGSSYPGNFFVYKDLIYFSANDGIHGNEMWVSNGDSGNAILLKDFNQGSSSSDGYSGSNLIYKDFMLFTANDGSNGREIWYTGDTGKSGLKKLSPSGIAKADPLGNYNFRKFTEYKEALYFFADYNSDGPSLWKLEYCDINKSITKSGNTLSSQEDSAVYQWIDAKNGNIISGETKKEFTPVGNGTYAVIISKGSCRDTSETIDISGLSIHKFTSENLCIFPNPAGENIYFSSDSLTGVIDVTILNSGGIILVNQKLDLVNCNHISVKEFASGIYTIIIKRDNLLISYRFMVS